MYLCIYYAYNCMDQRVILRKDNVWYDGNFIFSITTLVELQRKYLYYIATQTQCYKRRVAAVWLKYKYLYYILSIAAILFLNLSRIIYSYFISTSSLLPVCPVGCPIDGGDGKRNSKICFQFIHISNACVYVYNARLQYFRSS